MSTPILQLCRLAQVQLQIFVVFAMVLTNVTISRKI
uniref:Uncharacterized protein n=1 Tax=Myoviridae sp. ctzS633 TaxID=2825212 RepID=A0A8S5PUM5_9CAUD|nr:MAG TPA: hypothetical protein [Myoviridae sp. ctzS633]